MQLSRVAVSGVAVAGEVLAHLFIKPFQIRAHRLGDADGTLSCRIPDPRGFLLVKSSD